MYQETRFIRKTINKIIEFSEREESSSFTLNNVNFHIYLLDIVDERVVNDQLKVEMYFIGVPKKNFRYDIMGHRTTNNSFYIVELNKWGPVKNTFLLNDEVNSEIGMKILKEIEDLIKKI